MHEVHDSGSRIKGQFEDINSPTKLLSINSRETEEKSFFIKEVNTSAVEV